MMMGYLTPRPVWSANGGAVYTSGGTGTGLNYERTAPRTYLARVRRQGGSGGGYIVTRNEGTAGAITVGWCFACFGDGTVVLVCKNNDLSCLDQRSDTAVPADTWANIAVSYDGSSTGAGVIHYINGVATGRTSAQNTLSSTIVGSGIVHLATRGEVSSGYSGEFCNVGIVNKVLTPTEIAACHAHGDRDLRGVIGVVTTGSLVEYWPVQVGDSHTSIAGVIQGNNQTATGTTAANFLRLYRKQMV